ALLFGHGRFTSYDVARTAQMLPLFAPGVVPITLQVVITRAFYANEDSLTPVKVGVCAVAVGLVLNLLLGHLMGPLGPPVALSLTSLLNVCGLFWLYHQSYRFAEGRKMVSVGWRSLLAALLTAVATGGALALLSRLHGGGNLLRSLFATGFCFALYGLLLRLLRVEEMNDALRLFRRKPVETAL
ncbi:MAG: polysaccharide biosynthesis C-terminal domain-containing protein, partial [Armatimonadetes bacterium]|nr:polysaccharide biosynthesis C-terminal domain-containing protein [Armatimonadota bacterium]